MAINEKEILMKDVSWIPDTGRFSKFASGEIHECECYPPDRQVIIFRDAIVSAYAWDYPLPSKSR